MREDKAIKTLQMDIEIPEIVRQKSALVFEQIRRQNGGDSMRYSGKAVRKSMWGIAAAAVLVLGSVACAAYMHWSYGMEEKLSATQEQKEFLEENGIASPLNHSVTMEGITVTLQQSIADSRFAYLSFRVEGYQVREGSFLQPDFETVNVAVDGKECGMVTSSFFDHWHITDEECIYTNDGTPIKERKDGTLIERYMNEDGSMEYIIFLMSDNKTHSMVGEQVHVELCNLGTHVRYSTAYRKDIDAMWTFDFTLEGSEQVRSLGLSQPLGDSGATVTGAEISPVSLYVEYDFPRHEIEVETVNENHELVMMPMLAEPPQLTGVRLKDGTTFTYICNGGSEGYEDNDSSTYVAYYATNHIIDPADVDALLFIKSAPKNGEEIQEGYKVELYTVPLP